MDSILGACKAIHQLGTIPFLGAGSQGKDLLKPPSQLVAGPNRITLRSLGDLSRSELGLPTHCRPHQLRNVLAVSAQLSAARGLPHSGVAPISFVNSDGLRSPIMQRFVSILNTFQGWQTLSWLEVL